MREREVAKPLELYFDLVFVLGFTQCTALMVAQPTWEGIGRGMLVLAMPWWAWFAADGDAGRDPRTNVVTIANLAVLREVGAVVAGSDAADAALVPESEVVSGRRELAFDHAGIVRDAVARVRVELEVTDVATAFVGPTITLAELRGVCTNPSGASTSMARTSGGASSRRTVG